MSMKLLIVEDHPDIRRNLEKGMRHEGYAVDVVSDGTEGEYFINNWEYGGIILDSMLPGKGGLELLKISRSKGENSHAEAGGLGLACMNYPLSFS